MILSFTWNAIQILLKQGGVIDAIVLLAQSAMTIGVSVYILQNASYLAWSFINSLSQIAGKLSDSSTPFSPSDIFNLGLKLASKLTDNIGSWHVGDAFVMGLSAIVVLVIFAMITAEMTVLLVGSFVIVSGGTVMLAFLGSQWTRDYGMNYLTCIIGIGLQLFVMQLMVILGHDVFVQFAKTGANNSATSLITVGLVIVYYALIRTVPNMASSLATGNFRFGSGHAIAAAGTILGAAAGAGLLASSAGASATSTSLSKFVGSAAGKSVANTLQKGGRLLPTIPHWEKVPSKAQNLVGKWPKVRPPSAVKPLVQAWKPSPNNRPSVVHWQKRQNTALRKGMHHKKGRIKK